MMRISPGKIGKQLVASLFTDVFFFFVLLIDKFEIKDGNYNEKVFMEVISRYKYTFEWYSRYVNSFFYSFTPSSLFSPLHFSSLDTFFKSPVTSNSPFHLIQYVFSFPILSPLPFPFPFPSPFPSLPFPSLFPSHLPLFLSLSFPSPSLPFPFLPLLSPFSSPFPFPSPSLLFLLPFPFSFLPPLPPFSSPFPFPSPSLSLFLSLSLSFPFSLPFPLPFPFLSSFP